MTSKLTYLKDEYWKDLTKVIVFGFGRQGWKMYATLKKDFEIVAIVDNSPVKQGKVVDQLSIKSCEEVSEIIHDYRIIVTASQYYYQDIREQLKGLGLIEYVDFVMYQQFVTEWYYKYRGKINVLKTDISLTSVCTLNCENCMQFLPYWEKGKQKENSLQEIKDNLDVYFKCVDYVLDFDIVGGEPFLFHYLNEFVTYIGENYRDRIGYIGFITNGMIMPKDDLLQLLKKYNMEISISDYSDNIDYPNKINEICHKLDDLGISYMRNKNIDWFDFGFPNKRFKFEGDAAIRHMQCCNSIEHVLDNGRLYYCGLEWAAQKGGLYPDEEKAYIDLHEIVNGNVEKKQILEMIMANIDGGCLEFCKECGGFGIDNNNRVATAKQFRRN